MVTSATDQNLTMCGLFAVLSRRDPIRERYSAILSEIRHRGPDDAGVSLVSLLCNGTQSEARAWLGHARLAIIDLSPRGRQPMESADGRYVIIYNGEIYNFVELREECRALGARFSTETDTEVLLEAWRLWGDRCLTRLKGMFAFVLVDRLEGTATLVRDYFGIKPLYYGEASGEIVICSEVLPILRTHKFSTTLNPVVTYEYLRFGATNSNEHTILQDIQSLPPAHIAVFNFRSGKMQSIRRYWELQSSTRSITFGDAVLECRDRFLENVRLHLRSDVPVGAALSGGIDSTAVVCAMRQLQPELDLQTFSYIATDPANSEERWVDIVHRKVGGTCHKIRPNPSDLADDLELLVRRQGEPFASASMYAQFQVFQRARQAGVPVTLDGQGADELLGGYWPHVGSLATERLRSGRFKDASRLLMHAGPANQGWMLMARLLAQNVLPLGARAAARRLSGRELFPEYMNRSWFESRRADWRTAADVLIGRYRTLKQHLVSNIERGSLPNLLRYADRNSMAFSIESRVPFLTHDFAEFLMSLPADYLISPSGIRKYVFREAMRGILPEEIRNRSDKIGFFADDRLWLRRNAERFQDVWNELQAEPLFHPHQLQRFINDFLQGRHNKALLVWRILVFGVWLREARTAALVTHC